MGNRMAKPGRLNRGASFALALFIFILCTTAIVLVANGLFGGSGSIGALRQDVASGANQQDLARAQASLHGGPADVGDYAMVASRASGGGGGLQTARMATEDDESHVPEADGTGQQDNYVENPEPEPLDDGSFVEEEGYVEGEDVEGQADLVGQYDEEEEPEFQVKVVENSLQCLDGTIYVVRVTYDNFAGIPDGAQLRIVELNRTLTREEAEDPANKDRPNDTERLVSSTDLAKRGEVLDRYLELGEGDWRYATKHLELQLVDENGAPVALQAPVDVTVETTFLPPQQSGTLELAWQLPVDKPTTDDPYAYERLDLEDTTDEVSTKATFVTDHFGGELAVAGVARVIKVWDVDGTKVSLLGGRALKSIDLQGIDVDPGKEGWETREAFVVNVDPSPWYGTTMWLSAKQDEASTEGLGFLRGFRVRAGVLAGKIFAKEGTAEPVALRTDEEGFALVWDTGMRRQALGVGNVTVEGVMPQGTELTATGVRRDYADLSAVSDELAAQAEGEGVELATAAAYDISLASAGQDYQPGEETPVAVSITSVNIEEGGSYQVWHVLDDGTVELVENYTVAGNTVTFEATGFSVYVVVRRTVLTRTLTASDGNTYQVSVTCEGDAGVPANAELEVSEIREGDEGYEGYVERATEALGKTSKNLVFARAFDIKLVNPETGEKYQPGKDVKVSVELLGQEMGAEDEVSVVHFPDEPGMTAQAEGEDGGPEVLPASVSGDAVEFETSGFSVYVIVRHEGDDEVATARFTIHFISPITDLSTQESSQNGTYYYTSDPYRFVNKSESDEWQTTQIVQNDEALELIANPPNQTSKFFYGWYIVDFDSVSGNQIKYTWTEHPKPLSFETPISVTDNGDGTFTMSWSFQGTEYSETREAQMDNNGTDDGTQDYSAHLYVAPIYEDYCFVNFHELAYAVSNESNLLTRKLVILGSDGTESVLISDVTAPATDTIRRIFRGWQYRVNNTWISVQTIDSHNNAVTQNIDVTGDVNLYPYFQEGRWLNFNVGDSGNGAKYVPAQFEYAEFNDQTGDSSVGGVLTSLPITERPAYDFGGWRVIVNNDKDNPQYALITDSDGNILSSFTYYDKDGNQLSSGLPEGCTSTSISIKETYKDNDGHDVTDVAYTVKEGKLTIKYPLSSLTFYAKWNEKASCKVTVVIWKQKVSDDKDAADADKTYDYYALDGNVLPSTINSASGRTLAQLETILEPYRGLTTNTGTKSDFTGFHYGRTEMSTGTVKGDGSTVVSVYYDRTEYSIKFYNSSRIEINSLRITALYGQDVHNLWPGVRPGTESYSTMWQLGYNTNTYVTGAASMPLNGGSYYQYNGYGNNYNTIFWIEPIGGSSDASEYTKWAEHPFKYNGSLVTGTEDYTPITGFRLNAASETDAAKIRNDSASKGSDPDATYDSLKPRSAEVGASYSSAENIGGYQTLHFYYLRRTYALTFNYNYPVATGMSREPLKKDGIYYGASLSSYGPNGAESVWPSDSEIPDHYEFKGWYEDAAGTKSFDFTNETMPAADKIIYGKWEPIYYVISIDPNGGVINHINYDETTDGEYPTFYLDGLASGTGAAWDAARTAVNNDTSWVRTLTDTGSGHKTGQSTYFNAEYGTAIGEYELERHYVEYTGTAEEAAAAGKTLYYYVNMQFDATNSQWGLHSDLRNALYLTEAQLQAYYKYCLAAKAWHDTSRPDYYDGILPNTFEDFKNTYVKKSGDSFVLYEQGDASSYAFVGWYQVVNGVVQSIPYSFANAVEGPLSLRAVWRRTGNYYISYDPVYELTVGGNTVTINGNIEAWTDPASNGEKYNDGAATTLLQQPTGIKADGRDAADQYHFRGWRIVKLVGYNGNKPIYEPYEVGVYYDQAAPFTIDASYADDSGCIHIQAVYQQVNASDRRPEVANLTLNANGGYLTDGSASAASISTNRDITTESGWDSVGKVVEDSSAQEIVFGDMQSNGAVHLLRYAVKSGDLPAYSAISKNYFKHNNGYLLVGFDEGSDYEVKGSADDNLKTGAPFVPSFPADSVISVRRTDNARLYAVWEPMVYVTFTNRTKQPVTFQLSSGDDATMSVVNKVTGVFGRERFRSRTVNLAAAGEDGDSVKFVMPYGADKHFTVNGTNTSTSQLLTISSYFDGRQTGTTTAGLHRSSGADYNLTDTLHEDPNGVQVYFDGVDTIFYNLNDSTAGINALNTGTAVWTDTERTGNNYETVAASDTLVYVNEDGQPYEPTTFPSNATKPSAPTLTGYSFIGWTASREAAECDPTGYTLAGTDEGSKTNNLAVIKNNLLWDFGTEISEGMTLYAIWSKTVTVKYHLANDQQVWKETDNTYFVPSGNRTWTVSLAKGELVSIPTAPTWGTSNQFYRWVTVNSHQSQLKTISEITNVYEFGNPVTENLDLYTSWIEAKHIDVTVSKTVANSDGSNLTAAQEAKEFTFTAVITTTTYTGNVRRSGRTNVSWSQTNPSSAITTETQIITLKTNQNSILPLYFKDSESQPINSNGDYSMTVYFQSVTITEASDPNYTVSISVNGTTTTAADTAVVNTKGNGTPSFSHTGNNSTRTYTLSCSAAYADNTNVPLAFTNTRDKTDVTVTKSITSDDYLTGDETFTYTATYKDSSNVTINPPELPGYDNYSVSGDKATFTLKNGESFVLRGVPIGGSVKVTESAPGWMASSTGKTPATSESATTGDAGITLGAIDKSGGAISFTNTRNAFDVTVKNTVLSEEYGDRTKDFAYTATLWNGDTQVVFPSSNTGLTPNRMTMAFTLKHNETQTITGLPGGYKLIVTQTPDEDYVTAAAGKKTADGSAITDADADNGNVFIIGNVEAASEIDFTNTLKTSDYTITKNVQLPAGETVPAGTTFAFTAKLLRTAEATTAETIHFSLPAGATLNDDGNEIRFSLGNTGSITFTGLPVGYFLQVAESAPGYATYVNTIRTNTATQRIEESNSNINFINRRAGATLKVNKLDKDNGTTPVVGATMRISRLVDGRLEAVYSNLTSNSSGWLELTEAGRTTDELSLEKGTYYLTEDSAPTGYLTWDETAPNGYSYKTNNKVAVVIRVGNTGIQYSLNGVDFVNPPTEDAGNDYSNYLVSVYDKPYKEITVKKVLNDRIPSEQLFHFNYSYTYGGSTTTDSFSLTPSAGTPAATKLRIPLNATDLTITEDTTAAVGDSTVADVYNTSAAAVKDSDSTPITDADTASSNVFEFDTVSEAATVTFTNERKTTAVTISKIVTAQDTAGTFSFAATLLSGSTLLTDYDVMCNIPSGSNASVVANGSAVVPDSEGKATAKTDSEGKFGFTLKNNDTVKLHIPVGAKLTVQETAVSGTTDSSITVDKYCTLVETVYTATSGGTPAAYDGTTTWEEETKLYTIDKTPVNPISVSFSNIETLPVVVYSGLMYQEEDAQAVSGSDGVWPFESFTAGMEYTVDSAFVTAWKAYKSYELGDEYSFRHASLYRGDTVIDDEIIALKYENGWQYKISGIDGYQLVPDGAVLRLYCLAEKISLFFDFNGGANTEGDSYDGLPVESLDWSGGNTQAMDVYRGAYRSGYVLLGWSKDKHGDVAENAVESSYSGWIDYAPDAQVTVERSGTGTTSDPYAYTVPAVSKTLGISYDPNNSADAVKALFAVWKVSSEVCKITDGEGNLLYYRTGRGTWLSPYEYHEAVFTSLEEPVGDFYGSRLSAAFNSLYSDEHGTEYDQRENTTQIKMLVSDYTLGSKLKFGIRANVTLTTETATTGKHPYQGTPGTLCTITASTRLSHQMIEIEKNINIGSRVALTLTNITLDGNSDGGRVYKPVQIIGGLNFSYHGGSIMVVDDDDSVVTLGNGATLKDGRTYARGGAIDCEGTLIMQEGSKIQNCEATDYDGILSWISSIVPGSGGAINVCLSGSFVMNGGEITGCTAERGSAVYVWNEASFNGGSIQNNTLSRTSGGAIQVNRSSNRLYFSGNPLIFDNKVSGGPSQANVYLDYNSTNIINVTDGGLTPGAKIGVLAANDNNRDEGEFFGNTNTNAASNGLLAGFINDYYYVGGEYLVGWPETAGTASKVKWKKVICKTTDASDNLLYYTVNGVLFPALYGTLQESNGAFGTLQGSSGTFALDSLHPYGDNTTYAGAEKVKMLVDYTIPSTDAVSLSTTRDVTFMSAGKTEDSYPYIGSGAVSTVKRGYSGDSMVKVALAGAELTLDDIILDGGSTGSATYTCSSDGGIVNVGADGQLNVNSGATLQNSTAAKGGAIYVASGASVTMTGGSITGNNATNGGAIDFSDNTARLYLSGEPVIYNNPASTGDQKNVVLAVDSDEVINVIEALGGGAKIGVYADDTSNGRHLSGADFASHINGVTGDFSVFINDRDAALYGVQDTEHSGKVRWLGGTITISKAWLLLPGYAAPPSTVTADVKRINGMTDIKTVKTITLTGTTPLVLDLPAGYLYVIEETKVGSTALTNSVYSATYSANSVYLEPGKNTEFVITNTNTLIPMLVQKSWDSGIPSSVRTKIDKITFSVKGKTAVGTEQSVDCYIGNWPKSEKLTKLEGATDAALWQELVYVPKYNASGDVFTSYTMQEGDTIDSNGTGVWNSISSYESKAVSRENWTEDKDPQNYQEMYLQFRAQNTEMVGDRYKHIHKIDFYFRDTKDGKLYFSSTDFGNASYDLNRGSLAETYGTGNEYFYVKVRVPQNFDPANAELLTTADKSGIHRHEDSNPCNFAYGILTYNIQGNKELPTGAPDFKMRGEASSRKFDWIAFVDTVPEGRLKIDGNTRTLMVYAPSVLTLTNRFEPIARVHSRASESAEWSEWVYFGALTDITVTENGVTTTTAAGALNYANSQSGEVEIELLKETDERYTMTQGFAFDGADITSLKLRTTQADDWNPEGNEGKRFTATIKRGYDGASLITSDIDSLEMDNIIFDGCNAASGATYACDDNGGILNISAGVAIVGNNVVLQHATAQKGGAIYVNDGTDLVLGSNVTISGNAATIAGAGIYVSDGAELKLSGSPDFGGTDQYTEDDNTAGHIPAGKEVGDLKGTDGNFLIGTLDNAKNGDKTYDKARQDIYLEGVGTPLESLVLTENLINEAGSIWVWADGSTATDNHYKMLKQFAVLDSSFTGEVTEATYKAFRNARTDADTDCGGDYLTGQPGDSVNGVTCIYWTGGFDFRFLKTDGFGNAVPGATFTLFESQTFNNVVSPKVEGGNLVPYQRSGMNVTATSANGTSDLDSDGTTVLAKGITLFQKVAPKTYYMAETTKPTLDKDGNTVAYDDNTMVYKVVVGADGTVTIYETVYKATINSGNVSIKTVTGATEHELFYLEKTVGTATVKQYQVINTAGSRKVILRKVAEGTNASLADARFRIFRADLTEVIAGQPTYTEGANAGTSKGYYESLASGVYFIGSLPLGKYYLVETQAPSGYSGNAGKVFTLEVKGDGTMSQRLTTTQRIQLSDVVAELRVIAAGAETTP